MTPSALPFHIQKPQSQQLITNQKRWSKDFGFTLIELMIVVAIIAIILMLALPTYQNYTVRAKVGEALSVAAAAKTAVASACQEDLTIDPLTNTMAGYAFAASEFVGDIVVGGPCTAPTITVTTQNTGAQLDPVITLTGNLADAAGRTAWTCISSGLNVHVPTSCRS